MAKKEFGDALRRTKKKKKLPVDISAVESVKKAGEKKSAPVPPLPEKKKPKTIRTSFNFPAEIHEEMLQHCFKLRISMKDYLVDLVKKDRNLD